MVKGEKSRLFRKCVLSPKLYPGTRPGLDTYDAGQAHALREKGNKAFARCEFDVALSYYSQSLARDPSNHVAYANRSVCRLRLKLYEEALDDAERCVMLAPEYAKGYVRRGAAEYSLGRYADARATYEAGLIKCPGNETLERAHRKLRYRNGSTPREAAREVAFQAVSEDPGNLQGIDSLFDLLQDPELFEILQEPDNAIAQMVADRSPQLDALFEHLAKTLECDVVVLRSFPQLRATYDRATFACGQLLSAVPAAAGRFKSATRVVNALRHAMRCGWHMESRAKSHGVSKFAANALATIACSHEAPDNIRRLATRHLLNCMLAWLLDATPEPDLSSHRRDQATEGGGNRANNNSSSSSSSRHNNNNNNNGRSESSPAHSEDEEDEYEDDDDAWTDDGYGDGDSEDVNESAAELSRIEQQRQRIVCGCGALCPRLSAATWLERLFERGSPSWIREECEKFPDIELLAIHLCIVVRDERAPPLGLPGIVRCAAPRLMLSELRVDLFVKDESRWDSFARDPEDERDDVTVGGKEEENEPDIDGSDAALARKLQGDYENDENAVLSTKKDPQIPSRRLGEWLAASLGYLLLFVDGDELFSAHTCFALERLATFADGAAERVCRGLWCGVPLLEKLSLLACKDAHAVKLLEALALRSAGTRSAMLSLAASLAGREDTPIEETIEDEWQRARQRVFEDEKEEDFVSGSESIPSAQQEDADDEDEFGVPMPSWSEYFHELRGTLGIGSDTSEDGDQMVLLVDFETSAQGLPVAGELVVFKLDANEDETEVAAMMAVPAAWNDPSADEVSIVDRGMFGDPDEILGSDEWNDSIEDEGCVLVERSAIRKSPRSPDWASAVRLCMNAGAKAAIVSNDLRDDGNSRPAFRMGIFGAEPPSIPGFMVDGADGDRLRALFPGKVKGGGGEDEARPRYRIRIRTLRNQKRKVESQLDAEALALSSPLRSAPSWPLRGVPKDIAQAWALAEVVASAAPDDQLGTSLEAFAARMEAAEKRVWLARRLQRHHRARSLLGGPTEEPHSASGSSSSSFSGAPQDEMAISNGFDEEDPPLAFVECDRDSPQLPQLRHMMREEVGLGAVDITGDFEVRFKGESAVGSAVMRDWMDLVAHRGFVSGGGMLLSTRDGGRSFMPNVAACFVNSNWEEDFHLLGRLVGLALWQQVTLDLPLHAFICEVLLFDGNIRALFEHKGCDEMKTQLDILEEIDPDVSRSLRWILETEDAEVFNSLALPFTDALDLTEFEVVDEDDPPEKKQPRNTKPNAIVEESLPAVVVSQDQVLQNYREADVGGKKSQMLGPGSSVELVEGGENVVVTLENKVDFVRRTCEWRLERGLDRPMRAMATGLRAAVPSKVLADARKMLSACDFARLLSGLRDIDVDDWKTHTRLSGGLRPDSDEVVFFWGVIEKWSKDSQKQVRNRLHQCLQFATGSRRVPIGGFAHLVGLNGGKHPFTLSSGSHLPDGAIPTAHACICTVDLPAFESMEAAESKLLTAVSFVTIAFCFMPRLSF